MLVPILSLAAALAWSGEPGNVPPAEAKPIGNVVSPKGSISVHGEHGDFKVVFAPGATEVIEQINERRRKAEAEHGRDFDTVQKKISKRPGASLLIEFTDTGEVRGAIKIMHDAKGAPYQLWVYNLNEDGKTAQAVVRPGKFDEGPAAVVEVFDSSDRVVGLFALLDNDTIDFKSR